MNATTTLDRQFLQMRARILELAADFDRLDLGSETPADDSRLTQLRNAVEVLLQLEPERAAKIQQIFSREYDPNWQASLGLTARD